MLHTNSYRRNSTCICSKIRCGARQSIQDSHCIVNEAEVNGSEGKWISTVPQATYIGYLSVITAVSVMPNTFRRSGVPLTLPCLITLNSMSRDYYNPSLSSGFPSDSLCSKCLMTPMLGCRSVPEAPTSPMFCSYFLFRLWHPHVYPDSWTKADPWCWCLIIGNAYGFQLQKVLL